MSLKSFGYAWNGIKKTFKTEANYRFMVIYFILVVVISFYFNITRVEWAIVLICSGVVLILEMLNTAIECAVDLATKEKNILAEKAKDIAAGTVLLCSVMAFIVGLIIFIPYFIDLLK